MTSSDEEDAQSYNLRVDKTIIEEGLLDKELFLGIRGALDYDAATPVSWARNKIDLFRRRLKSRKSLQLYDPTSHSLEACENLQDFEIYVKKHFS